MRTLKKCFKKYRNVNWETLLEQPMPYLILLQILLKYFERVAEAQSGKSWTDFQKRFWATTLAAFIKIDYEFAGNH